jgi:hypothetical protein
LACDWLTLDGMTKLTLEQASEITGRPVVLRRNGFAHIAWRTDRHTMEIRMAKRGSEEILLVTGDPVAWVYGGECRKNRPRTIWVENPSVKYLKTLRG